MAEQLHDLNAGVLAPVPEEHSHHDLPVKGELPPDLAGTLVRNGPNPFDGHFTGSDMLSWWVAPSMLHGLRIGGGKAHWYRNRWVRSGNWKRYHDPTLPADELWDHNPNVNVISHAGALLALGEGGLPFTLGPELDTVGPTTLGTALVGADGPTGMTAHPKIDPLTGELCFFRADWQQPYLRYGVLDHDGQHSVDQTIAVPGPAMMHDFAITETTSLFLDLNVAYDFEMLHHGAAIPLRWHDNRTARIGLVPRRGGSLQWVEIEPCFIQHVINAYDAGPRVIVLDVVRYASFLRFEAERAAFEPNPLGVPWRYIITRQSDGTTSVTESQLDDRHVELPRIDEHVTGRKHRFVYAVGQPTDVEMRGIIKYDLATGSQQRHQVPRGDQNSEPLFVPRPTATEKQDDGWVIACVYRQQTDTTDVVVLDAGDVTAAPVATVELPCRIPAGFHGTWLPG